MLLDLKAACRELLKTPWFTCVVVLTLALGIGANTAIFGVVNQVMLNPLPYPDSDRLVYLALRPERAQVIPWTPTYVVSAWQEQARSFDGIEGWQPRDVLAYDYNGARVLQAMKITTGLPGLLGVAPLLGRGFTAADAEPGAPAVVMLSYETWQRDYGGVRDVLGRSVTLDEAPHVVVGVMPARWDAFARGQRAEIWLPQFLIPASGPAESLDVLGRLRPGVAPDAVTGELDAIFTRAIADAPRPPFGDEPVSVRVERPGAEGYAASTRETLLLLLGAVGLVLLVACSNVANLLLARGASRARELALRSALGASTWRLVRAMFAECLVLALAAGVVGVGLGWLILRILVGVRPRSLAALVEPQLDSTVLAFTLGVSAATALLFGLAPAVQLASRKLGVVLRHGASGVVRSGSGPRVRKVLVAAQMAVSVVLLVSAGLLIRSVVNLQSVDLGFATENLFSAGIRIPSERYSTETSREVLAEQLLDRIRSSSGVAAATLVLVPPPLATAAAGLEIRGVTLSDADVQAVRPLHHNGADYFSVLGVRFLDGRTFTRDEMRSRAAVLINRAAADRFWPTGGAVGSELKFGLPNLTTVVGVVDNSGSFLRSRDTPQFYSPYQAEGAARLQLLVRAADDPPVAIAAVRAAVQALDPEVAVSEVLLTETALANTIDAPRFNMALLTAFAVITLLLAAVGLAAVIGYEITERTHEIGIRMALGARTENVRRVAMSHGLTPAFVGVLIGVGGALAVTQLAASLLHGVAPRDPLTFAGVVALLLLVALGASWLPARRATRVDPIAALRAE